MSNNSSFERAKMDPESFWGRAFESLVERLELMVTFSTTGVGAYFFMLTRKLDTPLTSRDQHFAVYALASMAAATCTGVAGWLFDARCCERLSQQRQEPESKCHLRKSRNSGTRIRNIAIAFSIGLFALGMLLSGILALDRAQN